MLIEATPTTPLVSLIEFYLENYAASSSFTAKAKKIDLNFFAKYLQKRNKLPHVKSITVADWTFSAVQNFVDEMLKRGLAPATVSRRLATIKHFGRILGEELANFQNPARRVKAPKIEVAQPKALAADELATCLAQARTALQQKPNFNNLRNLTIFELLVDTGLRADEVRMLRRSQISDDYQWLTNVRTKARRYRNVYVSESMRVKLDEYLTERNKELIKLSASISSKDNLNMPLFISSYRASLEDPDSFFMGAKTLYRVIKTISGEMHAHPHLLRHSFAMDLLRSSNDIRLVSQALGHSDVRVTMRYTQRKDEEVANAIEAARTSSTKTRK